MWVAPSMWPATHSSSSRTSRTTASSGSPEAGTLGTCGGITRPILQPFRGPAPALREWTAMTTAHVPVREPAWQLSRSAIWLWVTEGFLSALVAGVAATLFTLFVPDDGGPLPVLRWAVPTLAGAYAVVAVGVRPFFRYRVHRWEVTGEAVYTLTGWLTRTWTLVPVARIQTVDVTRSVLQQLFGLSSVAVLTASSQGTVRVWHLEADVAQRVADDLAHRAEQVRDIAT